MPVPLRVPSMGGLATVLAILAACAPKENGAEIATPAALPTWTFDSTMIFPAGRGLTRPEDGVALADGRLIVADQAVGLRVIRPDGATEPFGQLAGAGYMHHPPEMTGGANGVWLEPAGTHLIVADVFTGAIYRVDVNSGAAQKIYQHAYGVNAAVRDSKGNLWFTQSTRNTAEAGEGRLWAAVDTPMPDGAVLRLAFADGKLTDQATVVADSLLFANGIALDERNGRLYVAEIGAGRVLRFTVDPATGTLSERTVFADSVAADNIELDIDGHLWMMAPLTGEIVVANTATGARHVAFKLAQTPEQQATLAEFMSRGMAGKPRVQLLTPALVAPLPSVMTGLILSPNRGPVYMTGLGDALVKLPR